jgi:hypothetical protein
LKNLFKNSGLTFVDNIGDYIFVSGKGDLSSCIKIRDLEKYEVK